MMSGGGNRAEADRWLATAEKLLATGDLQGAKAFAIRARDSDVTRSEYADRILAISDTLLVSETRVNNTSHPDWYAILRLVRFTSNLELVANQYQRLALLLDPSRNRLPYSDEAFKFVSNAWFVLSNPNKKALYDHELQLSQMGPLDHLQQQQQPQQQHAFHQYQPQHQPLQHQHHHPPQQQQQHHQHPPQQHSHRQEPLPPHHHQQQQQLPFQQHQQQYTPRYPPEQQERQGKQQSQPQQQQQLKQMPSQQVRRSPRSKDGKEAVEEERPNLNNATQPVWQTRSAEPTRETRAAAPTRETQPAAPTRETQPAAPTPETRPAAPAREKRPAAPTPEKRPAAPTPEKRPAAPTRETKHAGQTPETRPTSPTPETQRGAPTPGTRPTAPTPGTRPAAPTPGTRPAAPTPGTRPAAPTQKTQLQNESRVEGFWTACPYCFTLYEYPKMYEECTLRCQNCKSAFHAAVIAPPPLAGNDTYFCSWGFLPLGLNSKFGTGFPSNWSPISPMFPCPAQSGSQGQNRNMVRANSDIASKKPAPQRVYYDDDDVYVEISDASEDEDDDDEWEDERRKKKAKHSKAKASTVKNAKKPQVERARRVNQNVESIENADGAAKVQDGTVASTSSGAARVAGNSGRKQMRVGVKDLGKLDLNVEFSNEVEEPAAPGMSEGHGPGNGEEDNIEGIGFFEGLDEFLSSLPILSGVADDKVKAT